MEWDDPGVELAIYVIYGTSFIVMYLVMMFWRTRVSHLKFMDDFIYLAVFGFLHGLTEYSDIPRILAWQSTWAFDLIKLILVSGSHAALLAFGLSVISTGIEKRRWLRGIPLGVLLMYMWLLIFVFFLTNSSIGINYKDVYAAIDLTGYYSVGVFAAAIASYAFIDLSKKMNIIVGEKARIRFNFAGVGFALYALFGGLIATSFFGVPAVVYRSVTAVMITVAVISIFQLFQIEHQNQQI